MINGATRRQLKFEEAPTAAKMAKKGGMDLDSILDQALDDFEEIESAENAKKVLNRGSKQSGRKNEQKGNDLNKVGTESLS